MAPEKIVASKFGAAGRLVRQRPVCPYPKQAVYKGSGSLDSAESFECRFAADAGTPENVLNIEPGPLHGAARTTSSGLAGSPSEAAKNSRRDRQPEQSTL